MKEPVPRLVQAAQRIWRRHVQVPYWVWRTYAADSPSETLTNAPDWWLRLARRTEDPNSPKDVRVGLAVRLTIENRKALREVKRRVSTP